LLGERLEFLEFGQFPRNIEPYLRRTAPFVCVGRTLRLGGVKRLKCNLALVLLMTVAFVRPAAATPITFTAVLDGLSESPPNVSPATGFATVTIDDVAHTMRVQVEFEDLLAPNTAAHIHVINGPGDSNTADTLGPVATSTPTFLNFPSGTTFGVYDFTFDMTLGSSYRAGFVTDSGGTAALAEHELFTAILSGRAYLNIHSTLYPGGEIRGFLTPASNVPEPGLLLLLGAGGLGFMRQRSKQRSRTRIVEPAA
jgi:CHRD domain-containing protein/PEP-CTERM motif-containing protein